ncbi:putative bacteriocin precursor [Clostridium botulinum]|uniref:Bacteriocin n=1 Tax=Clostridium botulinum TaxID=1491 RepID=A0ABC8CRF2_CLOBO|nr:MULTISPECIES: CLI_3235 family bacteriocin precursor [Clostridium]AVQ37778.1 putative bacteriocin precursor [Clostridium botulinum]AVQ45783.1 putative bacteriocin precursor [Clostridium botulinum]AVQ48421.1 putative bacteriocin precursor [Clostridium botulinum]EJE7234761.1 CLI_3235 family bacteriocin precursor [Clostridium botulinum]NFE79417.1 putative bacteriocin precursor [Clostridium sporogenes]
MKKLVKKNQESKNTIEVYGIFCSCSCNGEGMKALRRGISASHLGK